MVKAKISKDDHLKLEKMPKKKIFYNLNLESGTQKQFSDKEFKYIKDTYKRMENVQVMLEKKFKEEN